MRKLRIELRTYALWERRSANWAISANENWIKNRKTPDSEDRTQYLKIIIKDLITVFRSTKWAKSGREVLSKATGVWFEHTRPKAVGDFLLLQNSNLPR